MFKNVIKNNRIFYFVDFEYIYKPAVPAVTNYTTWHQIVKNQILFLNYVLWNT